MGELKDKFETYRKEVLDKTRLVIGRVPEKYKARFKEIAMEEFADDYGLTLRDMVKTWDGIYVLPDEELNAKIDLLASEIREIKDRLDKPKDEKIAGVTARGRKVRIGGN